jgi:hypothetical protein
MAKRHVRIGFSERDSMDKDDFIKLASEEFEIFELRKKQERQLKAKQNAEIVKEETRHVLAHYGFVNISDNDFNEDGTITLANITVKGLDNSKNIFILKKIKCTICQKEEDGSSAWLYDLSDIGKNLNYVCFDCLHKDPEKDKAPIQRSDLEIAKSYIQDDYQKCWYYLFKSLIDSIERL